MAKIINFNDEARKKLEGIKVGDKVIFNKFSGNEIEDGDVKYLIVNADDILAVIE